MGLLFEIWELLAPLVEAEEFALWNKWFRVPVYCTQAVIVSIEFLLAHLQLGREQRRPSPTLDKYKTLLGYQFLLGLTCWTLVGWFIANGPFEALAMLAAGTVGVLWNWIRLQRDPLKEKLGLPRLIRVRQRHAEGEDQRSYGRRTLELSRSSKIWGEDQVNGPSFAAFGLIVMLFVLSAISFLSHGFRPQVDHLVAVATDSPSPYHQAEETAGSRHTALGEKRRTPGGSSSSRHRRESAEDMGSGALTVEKGDNFWNIALRVCPETEGQQFVECWENWIEANPEIRSGDPDLIFPGEALTRPGS